ncbi:excalibur calcium-binding domain-containing protein [Streptomyces marispadix]|uniref:Excalibur calcium-binding domain-containing protein n=1 Tax=Streptomyces marispadix TaxID=2922868 RepID=A0ABS9T4P1_9ACTN|nr:excalibur calcium-binding domain-containing protein [Streptomyces marispadix]MCH6163514.1 excalibur calcium-binding domain-containing protein [Streptomyces marispadix]
MKIRTSASALVAAGALGLALVPSVAVAHDGGHPFENCSAAYDAGYSNIRQGDEHYGKHLDRDGDGVGCDQPPADFVPAKDRDGDEDSGKPAKPAKQDGGGLAETGGDSTPYIAAAGGLVLVAGAGVLVATRSRRSAD